MLALDMFPETEPQPLHAQTVFTKSSLASTATLRTTLFLKRKLGVKCFLCKDHDFHIFLIFLVSF